MPNEVVVVKNELENLYLKDKLDSSQIAKIYNCSPVCIRSKLRKFEIPVRTISEGMILRRGIDIPKQELKKLYLNDKLSTIKIAQLYSCNDETVRNRLHKFSIPIRSKFEASRIYPVYDFTGTIEEKSYLVGFRIGDLWVGLIREGSRTICVRCSSTKWEQMILIKNLFSSYGHTKINDRDKRDAFKIRCHLNMSFDFLLDKKDEIPNWIYRNNKCFIAFLAGYFDAEGYMGVRKDETSALSIASYDKNILYQIYKKLNELEIRCLAPVLTREKGYNKDDFGIRNGDRWMIGVYRKKSLLCLLGMMGVHLKHPKNIRTMRAVIKNINARNKKFGNLKMC